MSQTLGQLGLGTIASLVGITGASSPTPSTIGKVMSAKASGASATVVKYSTLDGSVYVQKVAAVRDAGTWDLEIVHDTSDAGQTALATAFANVAGPSYDFKFVLPLKAGQTTTGDTVTVSGIIAKYTPITSIETDKLIMSQVTLDLIAAPAITPGS